MKKFIYLLTMLTLFISVTACAKDKFSNESSVVSENSVQEEVSSETSSIFENSADDEQGEPTSETLTIDAPSLSNNMINEPTTKNIRVNLPAGYESNGKRYPVVYTLHGHSDPIFSFKSNDMIVVGIDGNNKLGGSFYTNSPIIGNWGDFVTKDVVTYIDENYRTITNPKSRGICGFSMGGFGAWNLAMLNPDVFGSFYALSPGITDERNIESATNIYTKDDKYYTSLDQEYFDKISKTPSTSDFIFAYGAAFAYNLDLPAPYVDFITEDNPQAVKKWDNGFGNVAEKTEQYKDNFKKLKIGFDVGNKDQYKWITEGCRYFSEQLTKEGIEHTFSEYNGGHGSKSRVEEAVIPFFLENLIFE